MDPADLRVIADREWAAQICSADFLFRDLLPPETTSLVAAIDDALLEHKDEVLGRLVEVLPEIERRREVRRGECFDDVIVGIASDLAGRADRREMFARRLGLDGAPPGTLAEAAEVVGISRERMRQLEQRVADRLDGLRIYVPTLDEALARLAVLAPIDAGEASRDLRDKALTSRLQDVEGVLRAANYMGREPTIEVDGRRRVVVVGDVDQERIVLDAVTSAVRPFAVSSYEATVALLADRGMSVGQDAIRDCVVRNGATELGSGWYHLPLALYGAQDPLLRLLQSILAVAAPNPVSLDDLREGVARRARWRDLPTVPTTAALEAYCRLRPEVAVGGTWVSSTEALVVEDLVGGTDLAIIRALRAAPGGVLDRRSLQAAAVALGANPNSVVVHTTYSPFVNHLGLDTWGIRGVPVSEAALQEHTQRVSDRPRERRVLGYGWTGDSTITVATRVTDAAGFVLGVPAALAAHLGGHQWAAVDDSGEAVGTVTVGDNGASWGYGPYLRRAGAQDGDILVCEFDVEGKRVRLHLGDDAELDALDDDREFERLPANTRLSQEDLHRRFVESLGDAVTHHSDLAMKPLDVDLTPPLPPRVRLYMFNATRPPGGRPLGEFKIQLMVPGQVRGERASFDSTDGRLVLVVGYAVEEAVFVLWDAGLYGDFAWSRNVQVKSDTVLQAYAGGIGRQERDLRPAGGGRVTETVVAASATGLVDAIELRVDLSRQRLLGDI